MMASPLSHHNGIRYSNLTMEDLTEKEFKTVDEAERSYNEYLAAFGFGTRRHMIHRDRKDNITSSSWVCSKQAHEQKSGLTRKTERVHQRKLLDKIAQLIFVVCFCKENDAFVVTRLKNNHSYILATQDEVLLIRSHHHVSYADITVMISMRKVVVKTSRAYDYLVNKARWHEHVGLQRTCIIDKANGDM